MFLGLLEEMYLGDIGGWLFCLRVNGGSLICPNLSYCFFGVVFFPYLIYFRNNVLIEMHEKKNKKQF